MNQEPNCITTAVILILNNLRDIKKRLIWNPLVYSLVLLKLHMSGLQGMIYELLILLSIKSKMYLGHQRRRQHYTLCFKTNTADPFLNNG